MPLVDAELLHYLALVLLVLLMLTIACVVLPLYCFRDRAFTTRLCAGDASKSLNMLCCLPVLLYNANRAYCQPCLRAYAWSFVDYVLCVPLRMVCCAWCCRHKDKSFPPKPSSIGEWEGRAFKDDDVAWLRAQKLLGGDAEKPGQAGTARSRIRVHLSSRPRIKLFEGSIDPSDVGQGAVGNCWLVAAFAAAASLSLAAFFASSSCS